MATTGRPSASDDTPAASETDTELDVRVRVRLLTLAADLQDFGVRSRLIEQGRGLVLRCWNPHRVTDPVVVACTLEAASGCLLYRHHPCGDVLADASRALAPGDAAEAARTIAASLGMPAPACGSTAQGGQSR